MFSLLLALLLLPPATLSVNSIATFLRKDLLELDLLYEQMVNDETAPGFAWHVDSSGWGACSQSCGGGFQVRAVSCVKYDSAEVTEDRLCKPELKPQFNRTCNSHHCPAEWHVGDWTSCSLQRCGSSEGVRFRPVFCRQLLGGNIHALVDESYCGIRSHSKGEKPASTESCNSEAKSCPEWRVGDWSNCNVVCGKGLKTRVVSCVDKSSGERVEPLACDRKETPSTTDSCEIENRPCEGSEWFVGEWSVCDSGCMDTHETRHVMCVGKSGRIYDDGVCSFERKPSEKRECSAAKEKHVKCDALWHASEWSKCSSKCGRGIQVRTVLCGHWSGKEFKPIDPSNCALGAKMAETQECAGKDCAGLWVSGPWTKCSVPCGGGFRSRMTLCLDGKKKHAAKRASSACDLGNQPHDSEECNTQACDDDHLFFLDGCKKSKFGCCPDGVTPADGYNDEGCPTPKDQIFTGLGCLTSTYGCCLDGISPSNGPFLAGCPEFSCLHSRYGCCPDKKTPASGSGSSSSSGCPPDSLACERSRWGCCEDGKTAAKGPRQDDGCPREILVVGEMTRAQAEFAASGNEIGLGRRGRDQEASGERVNANESAEEEEEGSGDEEFTTCLQSIFGCCPDQRTAARGPYYEGCPSRQRAAKTGEEEKEDEEKETSETNDVDPLKTPYHAEDSMPTMASIDMIDVDLKEIFTRHKDKNGAKEEAEITTVATPPITTSTPSEKNHHHHHSKKKNSKPHHHASSSSIDPSSCIFSRFGCCRDGINAAAGEQFQGCVDGTPPFCRTSVHGCCDDGVTLALGPNGGSEEGCPQRSVRINADFCKLAKNTGPGIEFSIHWYFDRVYGGCHRFWYGGHGGNDNRFVSEEECKKSCVEPKGLAVCFLPLIPGPCNASVPRYAYDPTSGECQAFSYGGCLGNRNNFDSLEGCQKSCVKSQLKEVCSLPKTRGPCDGKFKQWHFDASGECRSFEFGGCKGNANRFSSKRECMNRCVVANRKEVCTLPKVRGPCDHNISMFYYDVVSTSCQPLSYSGCQGNANKFFSLDECEKTCRGVDIDIKEICGLPKTKGDCGSNFGRFHFDRVERKCKPFTYSGCHGNANRFESMSDCERTCGEVETDNVCTLSTAAGSCSNWELRYGFNQTLGQCLPFYYGGCGGNYNKFQSMEECRRICPSTRGSKVCMQPKKVGKCNSHLMRWHFDMKDGRCKKFLFSGCHGNDNRFLTADECERTCYAPTTTTTTISLPTKPTTKKPPHAIKTSSSCSLDPVRGDCFEVIPRWYFNRRTGSCRQFSYSGCGANDNNFNTQDDCNNVCMSQEHRSEHYEDHHHHKHHGKKHGHGNKIRHELTHSGHRGGDHGHGKTHIADGLKTSTHVTIADVCRLAPRRGPCTDELRMWFYEAGRGGCQEFLFGGCEGNGNNFETRELCEEACNGTRTTPEPTPVVLGGFIPILKEVCQMPADSGPCLEYESRYHFDPISRVCNMFIYGGCNGNGNNFVSTDICMASCFYNVSLGAKPSLEQKMTLPPTTPASLAAKEEKQKRRNEENETNDRQSILEDREVKALFEQEGEEAADSDLFQGGNPKIFVRPTPAKMGPGFEKENDHKTTAATEDARAFTKTIGNRGNVISLNLDGDVHMMNHHHHHNHHHQEEEEEKKAAPTQVSPFTFVPASQCDMPQDTGPCLATLKRFYFNILEGRCMEFSYGGCLGNLNRFETLGECEITCGGLDPSIFGGNNNNNNNIFGGFSTSSEAPVTGANTASTAFSTTKATKPPIKPTTKAATLLPTSTTTSTTPTTSTATTTTTTTTISFCSQPADTSLCSNATSIRWYFDDSTGSCHQFLYGGCRSSENNFEMESDCQQSCAPQTLNDVCRQKRESGPCRDHVVRWYFDQDSQSCKRFYYGGCYGNGNRFINLVECEATCGKAEENDAATDAPTTSAPIATTLVDEAFTLEEARNQIVCRLPKTRGPCHNVTRRFYFDASAERCRSFFYGGCQGNENNFESIEECQGTCHSDETPQQLYEDECQTAVDHGSCSETNILWYFDTLHKDCYPFIYGGCQGNANRFESYEECIGICKPRPCPVINQCNIHCPYGLEQDVDGCPVCRCLDPCLDHECPDSHDCVVEYYTCMKEPCPPARATCRERVKLGQCPAVVKETHGICADLCTGDSSCPGDKKCCSNGCGKFCVSPEEPSRPTLGPVLIEPPPAEQPDCELSMYGCCMDGYTPANGYNLRGCPESAPEIEPFPLDQPLIRGDPASLRCHAHGSPLPQISWFKDDLPFDLESHPHIVQQPDGSLDFMKTSEKDEAYYTCRAVNGIGSPAKRTVKVTINILPHIVTRPHRIIAHEGANVTLPCEAIGRPAPQFFWSKDDKELFETDRVNYEKNNFISIDHLKTTDAGKYVCTVRNGIGEPQNVAMHVVVERDVSVFLRPHKDLYEKGAALKLVCEADGHPKPAVKWFKGDDGKALTPSDRVLISDDGELEIMGMTEGDAGKYNCEASNERTLAVASTKVSVKVKPPKKVVIDPSCQDTPLLANCRLIVEAKLCDNRYYKKFCCRSCVKAGLLHSSGGGNDSRSNQVVESGGGGGGGHHDHKRNHHKHHRETNLLSTA